MHVHMRNTFAEEGFGGIGISAAECSSLLSLFFIESILSFSTIKLSIYFSITLYLCH